MSLVSLGICLKCSKHKVSAEGIAKEEGSRYARGNARIIKANKR